MRWYRDNWFYVGGVLFIIQAYLLILWGSNINFLRKLMILSFMGLNVHQFAEYAVPVGFPMVMNMAFMCGMRQQTAILYGGIGSLP